MDDQPTQITRVLHAKRSYLDGWWLLLWALLGAGVMLGAIALGFLLSSAQHTTPATIVTPAATVQQQVTVTQPTVVTPPTTTTIVTPPPVVPPVEYAPYGQVTGTDDAGYNIGPGCSDNPDTSLPGCADSPSIRGTVGSCNGGITIDTDTTSCGFAANVQMAYTGDGNVTAWSPVLGRWVDINCQTGGMGTTGYTICTNPTGSYVRWHS